MSLPEFSVNRRVAISMLILIFVVGGVFVFFNLGLDLFPDIDYPIISVITTYQGASSEDVERLITRPIEGLVSTISRVKKVSSISQEGISAVIIEFEWGTNLDFAGQDIRDQIGLYKDFFLPDDASSPTVVKFNISQMPIYFYGVTGERDIMELRKLVDDIAVGRLERIDGIASAMLFGGRQREIVVELSRDKLSAFGLSPSQVVQALRYQNMNLPGGHLVKGYNEYLVRTVGEYENLDEIRNSIISATKFGDPIYLKDVAEVKDTHKEIRGMTRVQGKEAVGLILTKQSGANTVTVSRKVRKEMANIEKEFPPDVKFYPIFEQAEFIEMVASKTINNAWMGGLLAVTIVYLFLRSIRPTIAIGLAIPLSIIITFISIYLAGYTLNIMTLGGLALGVGMLIDNAVVVIENIFRHMESGKDRKSSAIIGANEVGLAISASTLTTIIVFLPLVLGGGLAGKLVRGLALTVSFALLSSLFVAWTIIPMIASIFFKTDIARKYYQDSAKGGTFFDKFRQRYKQVLTDCLQHPRRTLLIAGIAFIISLALIPLAGTEFMPTSEQPVIVMLAKMPVGTSLYETDRVMKEFEKMLIAREEIKYVSVTLGITEEGQTDVAYGSGTAGVNEAQVFVKLKKRSERKKKTSEIKEEIRNSLDRFGMLKVEFLDQSMGGGSQTPIDIKVFGKDLGVLKSVSDKIASRIEKVKGVRDVTTTLKEGKPELQVKANRDKASRLGIPVGVVAGTVQSAMQGTVATKIHEKGDEIDVRVRFKPEDRMAMSDIENIVFITPLGEPIPLKQIAELNYGIGPLKITRESQERKVSVTANIKDRDLGSILKDIKKEVALMHDEIPPGYTIEFGGEYEMMMDAFKTLAKGLAVAILLVYMVMAAQFESLWQPFVIMFTLPLAFIGVVIALLIGGKTVSLPSFVGVIILVGIAVNNAIVLIDYVNQLRRKGMERFSALVEAGGVRLRPILITSITTIIGVLPMVLDKSEGSEMRSPLALSIFGGLIASTLLNLIVIPVIYSYFDTFFSKGKQKMKEMVLGEK